MVLNNLKVSNFRNYDNLSINFIDKINIIVGNNAIGKTNIIEAIYTLALTKSFRPVSDSILIKTNCLGFSISGKTDKKNFSDELKIEYNGKIKKNYVNGKNTKMIDYIYNLNAIVFTPDDIELIKGAPNIRRRYLNTEISQIVPNYIKVLSDYNTLLKIRNDYIKKIKNHEIIDNNYLIILEKYLIDKAVYIYKVRDKILKKITLLSSTIYEKTMEKDGFSINYKTSPHISEFKDDVIKKELENAFKIFKKEELSYGTTLFGPHKDDFEFLLKDQNLKLTGSQSQQKLAVLVFKLAEIELFFKQKKEYPLLLLDDIFSELDEKRKNNILLYLKKDIQTFITTTDINDINDEIKQNANIINLGVDGIIEN
ncbi:MAG: DNA replication/repair protein RecF [Bacilli bacterium]